MNRREIFKAIVVGAAPALASTNKFSEGKGGAPVVSVSGTSVCYYCKVVLQPEGLDSLDHEMLDGKLVCVMCTQDQVMF